VLQSTKIMVIMLLERVLLDWRHCINDLFGLELPQANGLATAAASCLDRR
jgi:hypothetical protein